MATEANIQRRLSRNTLITSILILVAALVGLLMTSISTSAVPWVLVCANGGITFYPLISSRLVAQRTLDLFSPAVWFCFAFGTLFFVRPLFDLTSSDGIPTFVGLDASPQYSRALALAFLGGISFLVGFYNRIGLRFARRLPLCPQSISLPNSRVFVALLVVLALAGYGAFLASTGGVSTLRAVVSGRSVATVAAMSASSGYFYAALQILAPAGILLLAITPGWRSPQGFGGFILIFGSLLPHLGAGNRSFVLPTLLSIFILYYLRRGTKPRIRSWLIPAFLLFFLVIVVLGSYRNSDYRTRSLVSEIAYNLSNPQIGIRSVFEGLDTAMVAGFAVELQTVPQELPFQFGRTYVEALARPIPRALWPGKPTSADQILVTYLWPNLSKQGIGFSFSFFGEPYFNFGVIGIVGVSFLFGAAWRTLYSWYHRDPFNVLAMAIFATSLPFMFVYLRGGLGVDYQRQVIAIAPFLLAAPLIFRRGPPRRT